MRKQGPDLHVRWETEAGMICCAADCGPGFLSLVPQLWLQAIQSTWPPGQGSAASRAGVSHTGSITPRGHFHSCSSTSEVIVLLQTTGSLAGSPFTQSPWRRDRYMAGEGGVVWWAATLEASRGDGCLGLISSSMSPPQRYQPQPM